MTKEEYINAKKKAGIKLHENNGIWWETTRFGYCKPALSYEPVEHGQSRPAFLKSLFGYNHRVYDLNKSVGTWSPFVMNQPQISEWSLENLKSGNRKRRIKKGIKNNTVELIKDISHFKEDFSRILKSTAIRNGHGFPPDYYDMDKEDWWNNILKVANYTEFWCSFFEGKMSAYVCLHVMGDVVVYDGVKSDTDMLHSCPIDAINYAILTKMSSIKEIKEIWYGGKSTRKTLDSFKESYGFEAKEIQYTIRFFGGLVSFPKFIRRNIIDK